MNIFLWRVGSKLGMMLKVNKLTSIHSRGQYTRFCDEVDLYKRLVPHIMETCTKYGISKDSIQTHERGKSLVIVDGGKEKQQHLMLGMRWHWETRFVSITKEDR
ncbi:hypothetical protein CR513_40836, partial [Mucuna pruriens]